jgi:alpha-beta hydrolase superfamily lysophospholipase
VIEFNYPSINPGSIVYAYRIEPEDGPVRGVLQIAHGMAEHSHRYLDFARFLASHGFVVVANDHLGHGHTKACAEDCGYFGPFQGINLLVADMHELAVRTREEFPDVPYFILGHSMGSFLLREYISIYGAELAGAIIMGTGNPAPATLSMGLGLARLIDTVKGDRYRSPTIANLVDGAFNREIEQPRTAFDWISTVDSVVDAYEADEDTGFKFTMNGYEHMFMNMIYVASPKAFSRTPKELPILLISGAQDPVGGYGKQVDEVSGKYKKAGMKDMTEIMYPDDRHEVLNEANHKKVYGDILNWLDRYVDAAD